MKYVIMADGNMTRWVAENGVPKHLLVFDGETLLQRLVRQLRTADRDCRIIITSHNKAYEVSGATRYEPRDNRLEIDRFTWELIEDNVCFLYGDTYYTDDAVAFICSGAPEEDLHFVGNGRSIVAVIARSAAVLRRHITRVREAFLTGACDDCRGWQVYQSYAGLPLGKPSIAGSFTRLQDETCGFDTWQNYQDFLKREKGSDGCI